MTVSQPGAYVDQYRSLHKLFVFRGKGNEVTMDVYDVAHKYLFSCPVAKAFFRLIPDKDLFANKEQTFAKVIDDYLAKDWKPNAKLPTLKPPYSVTEVPEKGADGTLVVKQRVKNKYSYTFSSTRIVSGPESMLVVHGKWMSLFHPKTLAPIKEIKISNFYSDTAFEIRGLAFVNNLFVIAGEPERFRVCDPHKKFKVLQKVKVKELERSIIDLRLETSEEIRDNFIKAFEERSQNSLNLVAPSDQGVLAGASANDLYLWDAKNQFSLITHKKVEEGPIHGLVFTKEGLLACLLNTGDAHILDPAKQLSVTQILFSGPVSHSEEELDGGNGALNIDENGLLISPWRVWDPKRGFEVISHRRGEKLIEKRESTVLSNGLVAEYHEKTVDIFDSHHNFAPLCRLKTFRAPPHMQILPDGRLIGCTLLDAVRIWKLPPANVKNPTALEVFEKGKSHLKKKDKRRALACFETAVRINPLFIMAYEELAKLSDDAHVKAHLFLKLAMHIKRPLSRHLQSQESKDDYKNRMKILYKKGCEPNPEAPFITHIPYFQYLESQEEKKEFNRLIKALEKKYGK